MNNINVKRFVFVFDGSMGKYECVLSTIFVHKDFLNVILMFKRHQPPYDHK